MIPLTMSSQAPKSPFIQKPFRCSVEFNHRLNKLKGARLLFTGQSISDNQFFLELMELGLQEMARRIESKGGVIVPKGPAENDLISPGHPNPTV